MSGDERARRLPRVLRRHRLDTAMSAPFKVSLTHAGEWCLVMRKPFRTVGFFDTQGEAIDFAYKNWPWWL